jgi:hypothetical protein
MRLPLHPQITKISAVSAVSRSASSRTFSSSATSSAAPTSRNGMPEGCFRHRQEQKLSERLGQPVVIDNRPGAGGNIAAGFVAKAPADGYTIFMGTISTHAINRAPDPRRQPRAPGALGGGAGRAGEGEVGAAQLCLAGGRHRPAPRRRAVQSMAGVEMLHVLYKGSAPAATDLLAGRVSVMFDTTLSSLPHVEAGKLRALAVTTAERSSQLPDLPTLLGRHRLRRIVHELARVGHRTRLVVPHLAGPSLGGEHPTFIGTLKAKPSPSWGRPGWRGVSRSFARSGALRRRRPEYDRCLRRCGRGTDTTSPRSSQARRGRAGADPPAA